MDNRQQEDIALHRWAVIAEAASARLTAAERGALVRQIAARAHTHPDGSPRRYSRGTIDRWLPDPPVDGLARDLHAAAARPGVHLAGDAADHPAPLLAGQPLLQRRPDQPVPEQRDVLRPGPPQQPLMLCRRHLKDLPRTVM
jgi:hypothetical protein